MYQAGKEFSVDKLVVLFQRQLQFKRYIRMRPCRYGIKLHVFTTSTNIALDWFSGKGMFHESGAHSKMATTERILVILLQLFHGKGHTLFTDNFYNSPLSTIFLLENQTGNFIWNKFIVLHLKKEVLHFPRLWVIIQWNHVSLDLTKINLEISKQVIYMLLMCHNPVITIQLWSPNGPWV